MAHFILANINRTRIRSRPGQFLKSTPRGLAAHWPDFAPPTTPESTRGLIVCRPAGCEAFLTLGPAGSYKRFFRAFLKNKDLWQRINGSEMRVFDGTKPKALWTELSCLQHHLGHSWNRSPITSGQFQSWKAWRIGIFIQIQNLNRHFTHVTIDLIFE